jgi:hypothetical protein
VPNIKTMLNPNEKCSFGKQRYNSYKFVSEHFHLRLLSHRKVVNPTLDFLEPFQCLPPKQATNILRSCGERISITQSLEGKEHPTYNTTKEDYLNWLHIIYCFLKLVIEGLKVREDEEEDVSSYWMTLRKREDTGI